jgi:hypothetical protein
MPIYVKVAAPLEDRPWTELTPNEKADRVMEATGRAIEIIDAEVAALTDRLTTAEAQIEMLVSLLPDPT